MEIITKVEQLTARNIFIIMNQFMLEVQGDLIDMNCEFIDGEELIKFLYENKLISDKIYSRCKYINIEDFRSCLMFYESIKLYSNFKFSINDKHAFADKAYQLIAEYIASSDKLKQEFLETYCVSFNRYEKQKYSAGITHTADYTDEDFPELKHPHPVWAIIFDGDLKKKDKVDSTIQYMNEYIRFTKRYQIGELYDILSKSSVFLMLKYYLDICLYNEIKNTIYEINTDNFLTNRKIK